jgi:hypothetical protein
MSSYSSGPPLLRRTEVVMKLVDGVTTGFGPPSRCKFLETAVTSMAARRHPSG